jgi:tRNA 5-methylaminomethyl-2-thiouridine biosynthesis bifunctional protein
LKHKQIAFKPVDVLVIGAGIAGTSIANQYHRLGVSVCIVDSASGPGQATSAHDGAITHPALGRTASRLHRLALAAYRMVELDCAGAWDHRGVFALAKIGAAFDEEALQNKLTQLGITTDIGEYISVEDARKRFGIERAGVWFPGAGSLNLSELCKERILSCKGLQTIWSSTIEHLELEGDLWRAFDKNGSCLAMAQTVVLANAFGAEDLLSPFAQKLYLKPVRGQLSIFGINQQAGLLEHIPRVNLSGDGYCTPPVWNPQTQSHQWLVGSTYDENQDCTEPSAASDAHNRQLAAGLLRPQTIDLAELTVADQFVGVRCVSKDRLPLIGVVPGMPNLYVATALGSRGLLWSTFASVVIPALSHSSDFALERLARFGLDPESLSLLSPARFFAGALASNSKPIFPLGSKAR